MTPMEAHAVQKDLRREADKEKYHQSEIDARDARIKELEDALRMIAGVQPWDDSDQGYVDKARAALKGGE